MKVKENKKSDKYLDLNREQKNIEHIIVIPIVIRALETIPKDLAKEAGRF